jgi:uncharacterized protein (TIGR04376 family)
MGVFEDMSRFLEMRLEEFLQAHPGLELQVLADQLRQQEAEAQRTLQQLATAEQQAQQSILKTADEVQRWHERIQKAEQANRSDLATAAREREAALLRQGNQQWAQMTLAQQQIQQTQALVEQIKQRRADIQNRIRQQATVGEQATIPKSWQSSTGSGQELDPNLYDIPDPVEEQFKRWEMEEELQALKRQMGR